MKRSVVVRVLQSMDYYYVRRKYARSSEYGQEFAKNSYIGTVLRGLFQGPLGPKGALVRLTIEPKPCKPATK